MRVSVDLPEQLVWKLTTEAERLGVSAGAMLADLIAVRLDPVAVETRIRSRVLAGDCDADIAGALNRTVQFVAAKRREMGLAANRRPTTKTMRAVCTACGWRGRETPSASAQRDDRVRHEKQCPNREDQAA